MKKIVTTGLILMCTCLCLYNFGMKRKQEFDKQCKIQNKKTNNQKILDGSLFYAVEADDVGEVVKALKNGADINAQDDVGNSVLHYAIQDMLQKDISDENDSDSDSDDLLVESVNAHAFEKIKILLATQGIDINIKNEGGQTPLHWAAEFGLVDVVKLLIKAGAIVHVFDNVDDLPLDLAMENQEMEILELLVKNDPHLSKTLLNNLLYALIEETSFTPSFLQLLFDSGAELSESKKVLYTRPAEKTILQKAITTHGSDSKIVKVILKEIKKNSKTYKNELLKVEKVSKTDKKTNN